VNPPAGDGSMLYSVKPKAGAGTGTVISNQATVFFDANPAINTPTWSNTIDNSKPVSTIKPLKSKLATAQIKLKPSGTDTGSGVASYNIYVKDDGGAFEPLLFSVPGPKVVFTGTTGHKYAFFSQAIDAAGNLEPLKNKAEAETRIVGPDLIGAWKSDVSEKITASGQARLKGVFTLTNQSPTQPTASGSFVRFYLSKTDKLTDQDKAIGEEAPFGIIPPKGSVKLTLRDAKLAKGASASGKYVIAVIDPDDQVKETDKTNNTVVYGPLP
jgi:hypothetical protein